MLGGIVPMVTTNLRDKKYELTPLGETQVEGRPAVGVKPASEEILSHHGTTRRPRA